MEVLSESRPIRKCPSCGRDLGEDVEFCPHCGNSVKSENKKSNPFSPIRRKLIQLTVALVMGFLIIFVTLAYLTPQLLEFYKDFSGGEAQFPEITQRLANISEEFRYNWLIYSLLLIPFPTASIILTVYGTRDDEFAQTLVDFFKPTHLLVITILIWILILISLVVITIALGLPYFNLVNIIN